MLPCEQSQQQMLSYLYDVLEPAERQELATHLESCPACQDALVLARQQQGLFAEAVKEAHPDIVFRAPIKATPASTAPTLALTPVMARRPFWFNRWALAASLLFVCFSAGSLFGWSLWNQRSEQLADAEKRLKKAKDDLLRTESDLNVKKVHTQQEIRDIQKQIDSLFNVWKEEETKTRVEQTGAVLNTYGPQSPQPGAPNAYAFEIAQDKVLDKVLQQTAQMPGTKNLYQNFSQEKGKKADQRVQTQIRFSNNDKPEYSQNYNVLPNQKMNFDLPPTFSYKPGDSWSIEVLLQTEDGKALLLHEKLKVGAPEYFTHLATDRPMYRPGDTVRFRSLTLDRFSLTPAKDSFHLLYRIVGPGNLEIAKKEMRSELLAGKGQPPVKGPDGQPLSGLGAGEFVLPAGLAEGKYSLIVSEVNERFPAEKRTFLVSRQPPPRFHKELTLDRPFYKSGDKVKVGVRVLPLAPAADADMRRSISVTARFNVEGSAQPPLQRWTDNEGKAVFECDLPQSLGTGAGSVTIECTDLGYQETVTRALPLVADRLQVEFFPEGGDLVPGVPNRVYFQVRTPAGKPAPLQGRLVDDLGQVIAKVGTLSDGQKTALNQGQGRFTFTPGLNRTYKLIRDAAEGVEREYPLTVKTQNLGVVLHVRQDVVEQDIPLTLYNAGQKRDLLVGAYCRGRLVGHALVAAAAGAAAQVTIKPLANVAGVYRITVFEKLPKNESIAYRALAERLVYRRSPAKLEVAITSAKKVYARGERTQLWLAAKDEKQQPAACVATCAVVDADLMQMAGDKGLCGLPAHFLLTTEVRNPEDLENADFLLGNHPQSAEALDLLLGCQGWRRFAEQDPQNFLRLQPQKKLPSFLYNSTQVPQFLESDKKQVEKLDEKFVPKAIALQQKLAEKELQQQGPPPLNARASAFRHDVESLEDEVRQSDARLQHLRGFCVQFGLGGALLLLLLIGFYLLSVGVQRLSEGRPARPWFATGFGLLATLFLISIVGTLAFVDMQDNPFGWRKDLDRARNKWGMPAPQPPENPVEAAPLPPPVSLADAKEVAQVALDAKPAPTADVNQAIKETQALETPDRQEKLAKAIDELLEPAGPANETTLRKQGNYPALLGLGLGRRVQMPPAQHGGVLREYAYQHALAKDTPALEMVETLYWHPALVLADGKGLIEFDLPAHGTRYQVLVLSHTLDGRLGTSRALIDTQTKKVVPAAR